MIEFQYNVNLRLCVFFSFRVVDDLTNDDGGDCEDDEGIPPEEASDVSSGDALYGVTRPLGALCEAVPQLLHSAALQTRLSVTLSHAWWGRHTGHTRLRWTIAAENNTRVTSLMQYPASNDNRGKKSDVGFTLK